MPWPLAVAARGRAAAARSNRRDGQWLVASGREVHSRRPADPWTPRHRHRSHRRTSRPIGLDEVVELLEVDPDRRAPGPRAARASTRRLRAAVSRARVRRRGQRRRRVRSGTMIDRVTAGGQLGGMSGGDDDDRRLPHLTAGVPCAATRTCPGPDVVVVPINVAASSIASSTVGTTCACRWPRNTSSSSPTPTRWATSANSDDASPTAIARATRRRSGASASIASSRVPRRRPARPTTRRRCRAA